MSENLCLSPDPNCDAHCILKRDHDGDHLFATPEARVEISQGIPGYRGDAPMPLQRPTTEWEKS